MGFDIDHDDLRAAKGIGFALLLMAAFAGGVVATLGVLAALGRCA